MNSAPRQGLPVPRGDYIPATRHGSFIFTAGMTPRRDGELIQTGRIPRNAPPEDYGDAVALACANALTAARNLLAEDERLSAILSMTVFVAAEEGYTDHSRIADFASRYLQGTLVPAGLGSRCAVGVATLPGDAPVEIQLIATV